MDERRELEEKYGKVWTTKEVQEDFTIHAFSAPYVSATHKESGKRGVLVFQDRPRFYFDWREE